MRHGGKDTVTVSKQRDERTWEIGLIDLETGAYRTVSFDRKGRYIQFHTGRKHETIALIDLEDPSVRRGGVSLSHARDPRLGPVLP